ncbi:Aste57867_22051 [Aphanomyces stellatus]|uniref:Aste57867_22051 protein n=1 Tax=Aphanomyces stellatus TaxID=120398 RepID=A0A485LP42_9STRA|nr:hypothetical protein As57867_021982 [Aphanomyces stellatus]VFT98719.1 Aste57867_22051 [Aphanomyces stellatus]
MAAADPRAVWEPMFQEALARQVDVCGPNTDETLVGELASTCTKHGKATMGLSMMLDCYERCERTFGAMTLQAMNVIGISYYHQNRLDEASTWFVMVLGTTATRARRSFATRRPATSAS